MPSPAPIALKVVLACTFGLALSACGGSSGHASHPAATTSASSSTPAEATAPQLVQAGLLALKQGNVAAATSAFTAATQKQPSNYYAYYNLGVIAQQQNETTVALQNYGLALTANPSFVPAIYNEATVYKIDNPTLAITTFRQVIKLQPKAPTAYLNIGLLEAKLGLTDQAKKDLQMALTQDGTLTSQIPKDIFNGPSPSTSSSPSPSE